MEHCPDGNIMSQINKNPNETKRIFEDVVGAIGQCHKQGICHRDIKPDNLVMAGHQVKIIDFGLSFDIPSDAFPLRKVQPQ